MATPEHAIDRISSPDHDLSQLVGRLQVNIEAVERERMQRNRDPARLADANADLLVSLARVVLRFVTGR
jgi:hypothetical protein